MNWVRLWQDMPTDPKWRVIAKRSGRPLAEVLAVFVHMMTNAGANATERGVLNNWCHDDVAAALDMEATHVEAIHTAMQGKTLDGDALTGWEKRQPKREDNSAERAKEWRERRRTQANAEKRPDSDSESDSERSSLPLQQEAAREVKRAVDLKIGVGVGVGGEVSVQARRDVAASLCIADAAPIYAAYRRWKGSKSARVPDAAFKSAARKIYANLPPHERNACGPILKVSVAEVTPPPVFATPSSALTAALSKGNRYGH